MGDGRGRELGPWTKSPGISEISDSLNNVRSQGPTERTTENPAFCERNKHKQPIIESLSTEYVRGLSCPPCRFVSLASVHLLVPRMMAPNSGSAPFLLLQVTKHIP